MKMVRLYRQSTGGSGPTRARLLSKRLPQDLESRAGLRGRSERQREHCQRIQEAGLSDPSRLQQR